MNSFTIYPNDYLKQKIQAFYHSDYHSADKNLRDTTGTVENIISTLKNDFKSKSNNVLIQSENNLIQILRGDLPQVLQKTGKNNLTVCVVPRAKAEATYSSSELFFKKAINFIISELNGFNDGTNYIIRHTDTKTTHLNKSGYAGTGNLPYSGITRETCTISDEVKGADILLVDDLYTENVNIDEDAIQALLDKRANSVVFYSLGKTMPKF